jgi:hypothetical protein
LQQAIDSRGRQPRGSQQQLLRGLVDTAVIKGGLQHVTKGEPNQMAALSNSVPHINVYWRGSNATSTGED